MIPIEVFTNIDEDKNIEWIDRVCCHPRIGEYISSKDRRQSRIIVSIVHSFQNIATYDIEIIYTPILRIEVTK